MKQFEFSVETPAELLAVDEAMLDACENGSEGTEGGLIRYYEAHSNCVVLGFGNRAATEVNREACESAGVPVLRRASGGGTVVLGPGCLAYAIVLLIDAVPECASVTGTNRHVMERNRAAMESVLGRKVEVQGFTDLVVDGWKFSGNAQRRRRRALLFHGTFLLAMDLSWVGRCLRPPSWEPEYRRGRTHENFVMNLGVSAAAVRDALNRAWSVSGVWKGGLDSEVRRLVREKYGTREWNMRNE